MTDQQTSEWPIKRSVERSPLDAIVAAMHKLQSGAELDAPLFNLHGLAGIGKTFVLRQLYDTCPPDCDVIWLGFNLKDTYPEDTAPAQYQPILQRTPWQEAAKHLRDRPVLSDSFPHQIIFDNQVRQSLEQLGDILFAQAHKASKEGSERPLLLLLDSLDNLPYWKWLQEQLIKPLFEQQRTLIICTSRTELNWQFWELRESCQRCELGAFDIAETREFLAHYHAAPLAETVQHWTQGYPLVLAHFARLMYAPSASIVTEETIQQTIARLTEDTRWIFGQVGMLRRLHVAVMQQLLGADWRDQANHRRLHHALAELKQTGIIGSSPDGFDRFVSVAHQAVYASLGQAEYLRRCDIIAQYYYDLAWEHPKHDADALIEWLYFSTERFSDEVDAAWRAQFAQLFGRITQVDQAEHAVYHEDAFGQVIVSQANLEEHGRANVGAKIAAWLYTDNELLQKLTRLGLLEQVDRQLKPLLAETHTAIPIRHDLRRAVSTVLRELGQRAEKFGTPGMTSFEAVLRYLLPHHGQSSQEASEFEQSTLQALLRETWQSLQERPARSVNEFIIQLTSSGMLRYDRDRRVYTFHPLIRQLLSVALHRRFDREYEETADIGAASSE